MLAEVKRIMQSKKRFLTAMVFVLAGVPGAALATERLRIEAGTKIPVRLERSVGTKDFFQWRSFGNVRTVSGTLMQDLVSTNGQMALPAGSKVSLAVLESKRAGHVTGRSRLRLGLYSVRTADGEVLPLDGYPTKLERRKVDNEGTAHGKRGLVKDAGFDFGSVTIGAGAGFAAAGPVGAAVGAGGGLLVAAIWTVARRGPDLVVPAGTVVEFVLGRPVSLVPTGDEVVGEGARLRPSTWGEGRAIPPSEDLLALADQLESDPQGVLQQLRNERFKGRPAVDRVFAKYLLAVARFQTGDHSREPLELIREAYKGAQNLPLPGSARSEIARNLVVIMRGTEKDWERDPLLNDPEVQAALVEEVQ
jgi:hypothetical protein